jgi:A/G-specific adenine glycosylase
VGKRPSLLSGTLPFRRALLAWYDRDGRKLPWRNRRPVPYRVWISEIMLQQTRVAAVLGHYKTFLNRFPTVKSLASAREVDVLSAWSGLGYYRRARMLHAAAKRIIEEHNGKFPSTSAALRPLPGIGRYTAAAIASICFHEPTAVVDGNVERVLIRLTGGSEAEPPELWELANTLIAPERPGDFNQALMELGALICVPKTPRCEACPVSQWCATRGPHQTLAPDRRLTAEVRYALAQRNGSIRLKQRAKGISLMAGMWELPALSSAAGEPLLTLRHSITTTDYRVNIHEVKTTRSGQWIKRSQVSSLPLTGLTRKVLRKLGVIR